MNDVRVRFSKRRSDGVLWGKSASQLVCLVVALFTAVAGAWVVAGVLVAVALVPVCGRPLVDFAPILLAQVVTRVTGEHEYRGGPFRLLPGEPGLDGPRLPGDLARLRFGAYSVGDRELGVVYEGDGGVTAAVEVRAETFALLDAADRARLVIGLGAVLNAVCRADSPIVRVQLLHRVVPDAGGDIRRDWEMHGNRDNPTASAVYEELLDDGGVRHESFLVLRLDPRRAGARITAAGGGDDGAAAVLFTEVVRVARGLRSAGLTVLGWVPPRGLGYLVRSAFDPSAKDVDPGLCHPMATSTSRSHYATDGAVHRTWWIDEWPRTEAGVPAGFLEPVLLGSTAPRTVSLVLEPLPARKAQTRIAVEAGADDARETLNRRIDRRTTRADRREAEDVHRREAELVDGFGHFRFLGFVSVTAPTTAELEVRAGLVEAALDEAAVEPRVLYWEQDQGFWAAALPFARGLR
ncbi:SCO6880 family protein [Saccharothrix violaceirubra]|uniref:Type VII secretion system protein EccE domain-containing protein n=1 Tax=Saccharothrix violaceirubra TaxID=413306 RepID=A0A7W7SZ01_9PSEU|nr:SCO6880 family protein [Saccharothrix violaceirubra]MBB4963518.1 hypothetical protein [Saccharothrix violaceirubra]